MTIASEVTRIKTNIAQAYTALEEKGATIPEVKNSDNLSDAIGSIATGGGSGDGIIYRDDVPLPAIFDEIDKVVDKGFGEINQHTWIFGILLPLTLESVILRGVYSGAYMYNGEVADITANTPKTIEINESRILYIKISAKSNSYSDIANIFRINYATADTPSNNSNYSVPCEYLSMKYFGENVGTINEYPPYQFSGMGGLYRAMNLKNCIINQSLSYEALETGRFATHILPVSKFGGVDLSSTSSWTSNFSKVCQLPNLPYGLDLSSISTSTTLCLGSDTSYAYGGRNRLYSAYISLPDAPVRIGARQVFTKNNWEYLATHSPTVTNRTLTMGALNLAICGGEDSEIITTLKNKGWTIA